MSLILSFLVGSEAQVLTHRLFVHQEGAQVLSVDLHFFRLLSKRPRSSLLRLLFLLIEDRCSERACCSHKACRLWQRPAAYLGRSPSGSNGRKERFLLIIVFLISCLHFHLR